MRPASPRQDNKPRAIGATKIRAARGGLKNCRPLISQKFFVTSSNELMTVAVFANDGRKCALADRECIITKIGIP